MYGKFLERSRRAPPDDDDDDDDDVDDEEEFDPFIVVARVVVFIRAVFSPVTNQNAKCAVYTLNYHILYYCYTLRSRNVIRVYFRIIREQDFI